MGRAAVSNGKLLGAGTMAPTMDAAKQIIELTRSGFQFQTSVGVAPGQWDHIRAGDIVKSTGVRLERRDMASRSYVRPL